MLERDGGGDTKLHARVHLLAGRVDAARRAARWAAHFARSAAAAGRLEPAAIGCVADWTEVRELRPGADAARHRLAALDGPADCRLLYADLGERSLRPGVVVEADEALPRVGELATQLRIEGGEGAGSAWHVPSAASILVGTPDPTFGGVGWAALEAAGAQPSARAPRARLALAAAASESLAGRHAEARRWATLALADLAFLAGASPEWEERRLDAELFAAAIELRAGDLEAARVHRARGRADASGDAFAVDGMIDYLGGGKIGFAAALGDNRLHAIGYHVAEYGDAGGLLDEHGQFDFTIRPALRWLAPRLKRGHDRFVPAWRWGDHALCDDCPGPVMLAQAADRADIAAALGETALAEEWRAAADRWRDALRRRDVAVPLAILESLED